MTGKIILFTILGLIVLFLLVIIIKAACFKPAKVVKKEIEEVNVEKEASVDKFSNLLQCNTQAQYDSSLTDYKPFDKFISLLKKYYPSVFEKAELVDVNEERHVLIKIKGKNSSICNVMMAHMDIVPAEGEWIHEPFSGDIDEEYIYGRGAIDTKGTLVSCIEATNELLEEGFIPENDLYLCFGSDEEVCGTSAPNRVKWFSERNIKINMVLDEGGAIVSNIFPGVKKKAAVVGTIEKGTCYFKLKVKSSGGHSSSPKKNGANVKLAKAMIKLEKKPCYPYICNSVKEMLDTMGRNSSFLFKLIFANMWCFKGLVKKLFIMLDGEPRALLSTTFAFTTLEGSKVHNALPAEAYAGINCRILNNVTIEEVYDYIQKVVGKDIEVELVSGFKASKESSGKTSQFKLIEETIKEVHGNEVIVTPYIMLGSTDSRHFHEICPNTYRFTPFILSKEDRSGIHGINEKLSKDNYYKCIEFYKRLIKKL